MSAAHVAVAAAVVALLATPDPGAHAPDGAAVSSARAAARLPGPVHPPVPGPGRHHLVRGDEATSRTHPRREPRTPAGKQAAAAPAGDLPWPWEALAECESGGNPAAVSPSGTYRGLFQFSLTSWAGVGGTGDPAAASVAEQLRRAVRLQALQGWAAWPVCSQAVGLR